MDRLMSMRVFQRVVDEGGFAAAARSLDMSPAVVTRLVADLEDHLGTRLLHRSTRRLSLSDAGELYLARVRSILQDVDEADAIASSQTQELSGTLHIQISPILATHVLAPMIAGFRERYPHIVLDIAVEAHREPPIEDFDVTLLGTHAGFDADVIARKIISTDAILVAAPEYLRRRGTPQHPQDLVQHACLRYRDLGSRPRAWRLYRETMDGESCDVDAAAVLWVNNTETLLHAALQGCGITATSLEMAAAHLASGNLVRILSPWITGHFTLYAALPSRKFMPQRTRAFLDYLTEQTQARISRALSACDIGSNAARS